MDASTCLMSIIPDISNSSISILFERVLPSLVSGLLFGGIPPYIIHISTLNFEFEKDTNQRVIMDCLNWMNSEFMYPDDVTDVVIFHQCTDGQEDTLRKVHKKLSSNPSQLARPNVICVFQMKRQLLHLRENYGRYIRAVISLNDLERKADGSIQIITRMVIKGDIQPAKRIVFDAEDIMQSFPSVYDFSLDLNGELLRVVTIPYQPFVSRTGDFNGSSLYEGRAISVLASLAEKYNFTYTFEEGQAYGSRLENGTWIGMVGQVSRQEKDLAVTGITINAERSTVVDFTYPFWLESSSAVMHVKENRSFYLFRPFTKELWQAILVVFVLTTTFYIILDFLALKLSKFSQRRWFHNINARLWYITQIWLSQSGRGKSSHGSLRLMTGITAICLVVIYATFSGNFIASLTVQDLKVPLQSLDDLSKSEKYFPIVKYGTVHQSLLETSKSGVYARLWKRIQENKEESLCVGGSDYCINRWLNRGHLVYLTDKLWTQVRHIQDSGCKAENIPEDFFPSGFGIAMPKGSPYKVFFDHTIKSMTETGMLEYFKRRYPAVNDTCSRIKEEMAKVRALTLQEAGAAFLVLGAGVSTSMTVLFLELIVQSVQKSFPGP